MKTENKKIVLGEGESVLWSAKPKKSAFIAAKSLTLLPIAIIWLVLDLNFIGASFEGGELLWFVIPFFLLHLMPFWLWLGNVLTAARRHKNTNYYVTNRRIVIQSGFFAVNETSLFYKELQNAQLKIGLLDKLFHTGDVCFDNQDLQQTTKILAFEKIAEPQQAYNLIQKIILDIQTDMEYPNALRPDNNPGYKTDYTP